MYLYYTEKPAKSSGRTDAQGKAVARATIKSGGKPGSWYKYYCQPNGECGFTEPGLGGKATYLNAPVFNISQNTYLNKFINITPAFRWYTSSDGTIWEKQEAPNNLNRNPNFYYWYPLVLGLDGSSVTSGKEFYYYFTKLSKTNINKRQLIRQKIEIVEETPTPKPGDTNRDGKVDGVDYVIWLNHYNQSTNNGYADGDFNQDGKVDGVDYTIWLTHLTN